MATKKSLEQKKIFLEFEDLFPNENSCRDYVARLKWGENCTGFTCENQGCESHEFRQKLTASGLFRCRTCDFHVSVRTGTIFENSRLSLNTWFKAIWQICHHGFGMDACHLRKVLGIKNHLVISRIKRNIRHAMKVLNSGILDSKEVALTKASIETSDGEIHVICLTAITAPLRLGEIIIKACPLNSSAISSTVSAHVDKTTLIWTINSIYKNLRSAELRLRVPPKRAKSPGGLIHGSRVATKMKRSLWEAYGERIKASQVQDFLDEYVFWQNISIKTSEKNGSFEPLTPMDIFEILMSAAVKNGLPS